MTDLPTLAARVEAADGASRELDAEIAEALGWQERRVSRLGLSGRTPGRMEWFPPNQSWPPVSKSLPRFTGPRKRAATIAALKARAS